MGHCSIELKKKSITHASLVSVLKSLHELNVTFQTLSADVNPILLWFWYSSVQLPSIACLVKVAFLYDWRGNFPQTIIYRLFLVLIIQFLVVPMCV